MADEVHAMRKGAEEACRCSVVAEHDFAQEIPTYVEVISSGLGWIWTIESNDIVPRAVGLDEFFP